MLYDLIIIGAGPAGITAGIYAARKKLNMVLVTKDFVGQTGKASHIENWPGIEQVSGIELMENFKKHLKKFKVEIKEGQEVKNIKKDKDFFDIETAKGERFQAAAVIIASGRNPRPLQVPGEKELFGKGVSYCSICEAPLFKDKVVAVVGGGNSAFMAVLDLIPYCPKVYVLEATSAISADQIYQERAEYSKKVEIILNAKISEIRGKNKVESVIYQDLNSEETKELPVEGVFVEIGGLPVTAFLNNLAEFNEQGEIKINPLTCETKTQGLFAAGDVTDVKYKQIIIAASEGAKAALAAYEYIKKRDQN